MRLTPGIITINRIVYERSNRVSLQGPPYSMIGSLIRPHIFNSIQLIYMELLSSYKHQPDIRNIRRSMRLHCQPNFAVNVVYRELV